MLRFLAIAGFILVLLSQLAPAEAACVSDSDFAAGAVAEDATLALVVLHDEHVPCSDTSHRHVSCVCAGHFFVPAQACASPQVAYTLARFDLTRKMLMGRTLQPPVPPPLA
ncbi:MAG: hypothetical protein SGJ03_17780 [Alphaproteobacteria bacterium]|nr:hypothetical protein [Alphaproteobacteria bacterium]